MCNKTPCAFYENCFVFIAEFGICATYPNTREEAQPAQDRTHEAYRTARAKAFPYLRVTTARCPWQRIQQALAAMETQLSPQQLPYGSRSRETCRYGTKTAYSQALWGYKAQWQSLARVKKNTPESPPAQQPTGSEDDEYVGDLFSDFSDSE